MRPKRLVIVFLVGALGGAAICAGGLSFPFLMPPLLDRLGNIMPSEECPDPTGLLLAQEDLPGEWEQSAHPRPETYLKPPFAMLRDEGESSAGRLYVLWSDKGKAWAVERVYCTRNSLRAIAFYVTPGFAGYVDALAQAEGAKSEDGSVEWDNLRSDSDQRLSRCRTSTFGPVSALSPIAFDPPVPETACGLWARYGRYVVAFEIHWTDDVVTREEIERAVADLEANLDSAP